jgi:hypothetical protein
MDSRNIRLILVLGVVLVMSIYLGLIVATDQGETLVWVGGIGTLVTCLALGKNVWALIPLAAALAGHINAVPGAPAAWYFGVALAGSFMALRFAVGGQPMGWRWTGMDTLVALQIVVLAQAYLRNPTGFALFGGDVVGGKPNIEYGLAIVGFYLMSFVKTDFATVRKVIIAIIVVKLLDSALLAVSGFFPGLAFNLSRFYSNVDVAAAESVISGGGFEVDADTRLGSFLPLSLLLGTICFSYYRPITCAIPLFPLRFVMFVASMAMILFSGFRSSLIRLGFLFIGGSLIRRQKADILAGALMGFFCLVVVVAANQVDRLPFAAQRVLSFLPVDVSAGAKADATGSMEWRFEMWHLVLTTDTYIQNKLLGDGFGYSAAEQKAYLDAKAGLTLTSESGMDYFLSKGSYHGFHVEAIRFTGVLGMIVAIAILIGFARQAWKIMVHFRGRKEFGMIAFIGLPFAIDPFFYLLIHGSYKSGFVAYLLAAGLVKMLDNIRVAELAAEPVTETQALPAPGMRRFGPAIAGR